MAGELRYIPDPRLAQAGESASDMRIGGVLYAWGGTSGNVGAGEDVLHSWNVPANVLNVNYRALRVTVWGSTANTATNKTIKLKFGPATLRDTTAQALQNISFMFEALIVRTASGAASAATRVLQGSTAVQLTQATAGIADTAPITIAVTGESAAAADNDVVLRGFVVEVLN